MVKMAKRRRSRARRYYGKIRHSVKHMTIPIAPVAGILAMPALGLMAYDIQKGNVVDFQHHLGNIVGLSSAGKFDMDTAKNNWIPLFLGFAVHKAAGWLGVNRALAAAKIPLIRV
jgi:hypothetical protein